MDHYQFFSSQSFSPPFLERSNIQYIWIIINFFRLSPSLHPCGAVPRRVWREVQEPRDQGEFSSRRLEKKVILTILKSLLCVRENKENFFFVVMTNAMFPRSGLARRSSCRWPPLAPSGHGMEQLHLRHGAAQGRRK